MPWQLKGLLCDHCLTQQFIWDWSKCFKPVAVPMPLQINTQVVETVQLLPWSSWTLFQLCSLSFSVLKLSWVGIRKTRGKTVGRTRWHDTGNTQLNSILEGPVCQKHWRQKGFKMTVKEDSVELELMEAAQVFNWCTYCLIEAVFILRWAFFPFGEEVNWRLPSCTTFPPIYSM